MRDRELMTTDARGRGFLRPPAVRLVFLVLVLAGLCLTGAGCSDLTGEALLLEQRGDLAAAADVYRQVIADDPDDLEALGSLAFCLFRMGRYDEALVIQERVVELDSDDVQTRLELGFNYLSHQDRPADAVRVFREVAALEASGKNLTFLSQALLGSGDAGGAEETLRRAIAVEPGYPKSYMTLVWLLESQGLDDEANEVVEEAAANGVVITDSAS